MAAMGAADSAVSLGNSPSACRTFRSLPSQDKAGNVGGLWSGSVAVNVVEWHPSQRSYLRASLQQKSNVLKNRQQQNAGLTLTLFSDGLPDECRCSVSTRYIVLAEWRIDVIAMAPLQVQRVETLGQWGRTRIEIKLELGVELAVQCWRCDPITPTAAYASRFVEPGQGCFPTRVAVYLSALRHFRCIVRAFPSDLSPGPGAASPVDMLMLGR